MNSNEIKTAADFTMRDQSSQPYAWIMEGSSPEALKDCGNVEQFVREYVRGTIAGWYEPHSASDTTVYKVWRSQSGEFQQIVNYIRSEHIS